MFLTFMTCVISFLQDVFTALHAVHTRSSDENSVRPSVCLSVKRVHCDKTEKICPDFYTVRKII